MNLVINIQQNDISDIKYENDEKIKLIVFIKKINIFRNIQNYLSHKKRRNVY